MSITITPERCPECGGIPTSYEEVMKGDVLILPADDDSGFIYEGSTDLDWNSQVRVPDENGNVLVKCDKNHVWPAKVEGEG
jgi:hypothetical protein